MNYDLAKELKDAGFPEITRAAAELNLQRYRPMNDPDVSYPFLQELVAEVQRLIPNEWLLLPDPFGGMDDWEAIKGSPEGYWSKTAHGKSPEEAVARLWLALHPQEAA